MGERIQLPKEIKKKMDLWRAGLIGMPKEYIEFHKQLAEKALEAFKEKGIKVHNTYMASSGWFDGMRQLEAIIELPLDRLFKIKWDDGSQCFFQQSTSGGSFPFRLEEHYKNIHDEIEENKRIAIAQAEAGISMD